MNRMENPRGYAFVSLHRAYEKMLGWGWFAAAVVYGNAPDKGEWMEQGLQLYDLGKKVGETEEETRQLVADIVYHLGDGIRQEHIGKIGARRMPDGKIEHYPKTVDRRDAGYEIHVDPIISPQPDPDDVIEDMTLEYNMKVIKEVLTEDQYALVQEFVFGQHTSLASAARAVGLDSGRRQKAERGIRKNREAMRKIMELA